MIQFRTAADVELSVYSAGFFIPGTVYESVDARIENGACAHGTRLYGNIKRTASQTPAGKFPASFLNGQNLRMGGCILSVFAEIVRTGDDRILPDQYAADGDFSHGCGFFCLPERQKHILLVGRHNSEMGNTKL